MRLVEEREGLRGGGSGVRPVDPREAARGKVEYVKVGDGTVSVQCDLSLAVGHTGSRGLHKGAVRPRRNVASSPLHPCLARPRPRPPLPQVKDWGSGEPEDLGSLQVDKEATRVFEAPAGGSGEAGSSGAAGAGSSMPLHEVLARRLEYLQSQGALGGMAQASGTAGWDAPELGTTPPMRC